jgi:hypothetical protein
MYSSPGVWRNLVLSKEKPVLKAKTWAEQSTGMIRTIIFNANFDLDRFDGVAEALEPCVASVKSLTIRCPPRQISVKWRGRMRGLKQLNLDFDKSYMVGGGNVIDTMDAGLLSDDSEGLLSLEIKNWVIEVAEHSEGFGGWQPGEAGNVQGDDQGGGGGPTAVLKDDNIIPRFKKLQSLKIHSCTVRSFRLDTYDLLRMATDATIVDFYYLTIHDRLLRYVRNFSPGPRTDIQLSKLVSYTECATYAAGPMNERITPVPTFQHIYAENLRALSFYNPGGEIGRPRQFIQVSKQIMAPGLKLARPHITSLDVGHGSLTLEQLKDILAQLPELKHLNIAFCGLEDDTLQVLAGGDGLGRKIQALGLAGNDKITTSALRMFINSRLPSSDKLAIAIPTSTPKSSFNAFKPTSSQSSRSRKSSQSHSQPTSTPPNTSASSTPPATKIHWLNIDHIENIEDELVYAIRKTTRFVSHARSGKVNHDRVRGIGQFGWDLDYGDNCSADGRGKCELRKRPGECSSRLIAQGCRLCFVIGSDNVWYVHHVCQSE